MRYYPIKIKDLENRDENKFILMGKVKEVSDTFFVLKDESGETKILSLNLPKKNDIVRVFVRKEGNDLIAEIVQNLNGLNLNILKEVEELYNKVERYV
ncbi:MAG: hypothetical protein B6U78_01100 [Candidatus Aenigmarchaeota archaeon ex4484_224]|nr:MAG: hypothetical protein B6U78_01100 [Candidatus Aenigmarchaeota archaeon ex4484_224]